MRKTSLFLAVVLFVIHTSSANAGWNSINRWFGELWSDGYHTESDSWNNPKPNLHWQKKAPVTLSQYYPKFPGMRTQSDSNAVVQNSISKQQLVPKKHQYDRAPKLWHAPGYPASTQQIYSGYQLPPGAMNSQLNTEFQNQPTPARPETNPYLPVETIPEPQNRQRINWDQQQQFDLNPPSNPTDFGNQTTQVDPRFRQPSYNRPPVYQQPIQNISAPLMRTPAPNMSYTTGSSRNYGPQHFQIQSPAALQLPERQYIQPQPYIQQQPLRQPVQYPGVPQRTARPQRPSMAQWPN